MYLNETYSKVHVDKHLSDTLDIGSDLKQGHDFLSLLFNLVQNMPLQDINKVGRSRSKHRANKAYVDVLSSECTVILPTDSLKRFKYFGMTPTDRNRVHEEI
jgi:hypothetical protein